MGSKGTSTGGAAASNRIDDPAAVFDAKLAAACDVVLAPHNGHLVLAGERGHIDDDVLGQKLFVAFVRLKNDAPFPLASRRLVGHRVVAHANEIAHDSFPRVAAPDPVTLRRGWDLPKQRAVHKPLPISETPAQRRRDSARPNASD